MLYLLPLLLGFIFNSASAFTTAWSRCLGAKRAQRLCFFLRNILGIPLWSFGFFLASRQGGVIFYTPTRISLLFGWVVIAFGAVIISLALVEIQKQAFMPTISDSLVQHGIYTRVRHPLYSGVVLEFTGLAIIQPTNHVWLAGLLGCLWVMLQARLEEHDLLERIPAYRQYMQRVPRFIPRLRH